MNAYQYRPAAPTSGCVPCGLAAAAAEADEDAVDRFPDGTIKPSWWKYLPFVFLGGAALAGGLFWLSIKDD